MATAILFRTATTQANNPDVTPTPEPPDLVDVMPDRVVNNIDGTFARLDSPNEISTKIRSSYDGRFPDHIYAVYRYESDDVDTIVDDFVNKVVGDADWYAVVPYHGDTPTDSVPYDGDELPDKRAFHGDVPSGLPKINA